MKEDDELDSELDAGVEPIGYPNLACKDDPLVLKHENMNGGLQIFTFIKQT